MAATAISPAHAQADLTYVAVKPCRIADTRISSEGVIDANTFFENGDPVADDYVEVEDDDGNGVADSVEIED